MSGIATAVIGSAVIGGVVASSGASKAASATKSAAAGSIGEQQRQYDLTRQDFAPYRQAGYGALNILQSIYDPNYTGFDVPGTEAQVTRSGGKWAKLLNLPSTRATTAGTPDAQYRRVDPMSTFTASPGYQFRLNEGNRAIGASAAARGRVFSGAAVKAAGGYSQGLASEEWNNYIRGVQSLAGVGQTATGSTAAAGANAADRISQSYLARGAGQASAYLTGAEGVNDAIQGGIGNWITYKYGKP